MKTKNKCLAILLSIACAVCLIFGSLFVFKHETPDTASAEETAEELRITQVSALTKGTNGNGAMYSFQITFDKNLVTTKQNWINRTSWPGENAAGLKDNPEEYEAVRTTLTESLLNKLYINGKSFGAIWTEYQNQDENIGKDVKSHFSVHANGLESRLDFVIPAQYTGDAQIKTNEDGSVAAGNTLEIKKGFVDALGHVRSNDAKLVFNGTAWAYTGTQEGDLNPTRVTTVVDNADNYTISIMFDKNVVLTKQNWLNRTSPPNAWPSASAAGVDEEEFVAVRDTLTDSLLNKLYFNGKSYNEIWQEFKDAGKEKSLFSIHAPSTNQINVNIRKEYSGDAKVKTNADGSIAAGNTLVLKAGFMNAFGHTLKKDVTLTYNTTSKAWEAAGETRGENQALTLKKASAITTNANGTDSFAIYFNETLTPMGLIHINYPVSGMSAQAGGGAFAAYNMQIIGNLREWGVFDSIHNKIEIDGKTVAEIMEGKGSTDLCVHLYTDRVEFTLNDKIDFDANANHTITFKEGFKVYNAYEAKTDLSFYYENAIQSWLTTARPTLAPADPLGVYDISGVKTVENTDYFNISFNDIITEVNYVHAQYPIASMLTQAGNGTFGSVAEVEALYYSGLYESIQNKLLVDGKTIAEWMTGKGVTDVMVHVYDQRIEVRFNDNIDFDPAIEHTVKLLAGFRGARAVEVEEDVEYQYKNDIACWLTPSTMPAPSQQEVKVTSVSAITTGADNIDWFMIYFDKAITSKTYIHANFPFKALLEQVGDSNSAFANYTVKDFENLYYSGLYASVRDKLLIDGKSVGELMVGKGGTDIMVHVYENRIEIGLQSAIDFDGAADHTVTLKEGFAMFNGTQIKSDVSYDWYPNFGIWRDSTLEPLDPELATEQAKIVSIDAPRLVNNDQSGDYTILVYFDKPIAWGNSTKVHMQATANWLRATNENWGYTEAELESLVVYGVLKSVSEKILINGKTIAELKQLEQEEGDLTLFETSVYVHFGYSENLNVVEIRFNKNGVNNYEDLGLKTLEFKSGFVSLSGAKLEEDVKYVYDAETNAWYKNALPEKPAEKPGENETPAGNKGCNGSGSALVSLVGGLALIACVSVIVGAKSKKRGN